MSTTQEQIMVIQREEYILSSEDWVNMASVAEDSVHGKLIDANVKCLLGLGVVPIIVGIATGIWPVVLAGLGPWLLAWLDTNQRRRERKR